MSHDPFATGITCSETLWECDVKETAHKMIQKIDTPCAGNCSWGCDENGKPRSPAPPKPETTENVSPTVMQVRDQMWNEIAQMYAVFHCEVNRVNEKYEGRITMLEADNSSLRVQLKTVLDDLERLKSFMGPMFRGFRPIRGPAPVATPMSPVAPMPQHAQGLNRTASFPI